MVGSGAELGGVLGWGRDLGGAGTVQESLTSNFHRMWVEGLRSARGGTPAGDGEPE